MSDTLELGGAELVYTNDLAKLADQYTSGRAYGAGGALVLAIAAMRQKYVYFAKNRTGEGEGWKGLEQTLRRPEMAEVAKSDLSKATKVVAAFLPEALTCEEDDIVSHVLVFVNQHRSLNAAYEAWNAQNQGRDDHRRVWTLTGALETAVKKAVKEGIVREDVEEAFASILGKHYPTD